MKYWILTTEFPPLYGGGISTYCRETAEMMSANGHMVTVFVYDYSIEKITESYSDKIRIVRFKPLLTDAYKFMGFTASLSYEYAEIVKNYLEKEGDPDIIESQDYNGIAYFLQQFKLQGIDPFKKLKIVITSHAPSFICLEYNQVPVYQFPHYWTGEMEKASIKSADLVIFPSKFLKNEIEKKISIDSTNHLMIANPIQFHAATSENIKGVDQNMIVCFGKLSPLKGSFELVSYFKKLWDEGSALQLYFVGGTDYFFYPEGKTMHDLLSQKYKSYIDRQLLIFTGNLSADSAQAYLKKAKLIVIPSLFDNFPYTVLEAMSLGKIVLASNQGGQTEMITDGENGFLFSHKKEFDFLKQLKKIINLNHDQYNLIAQKALLTVKNKFSPSIIYQQKIIAIKELLQKETFIDSYPFIRETADFVSNYTNVKSADINLSVIIPYFNMGHYIDDCLLSVLNSTYKPNEIIIIDDGSTDAFSISKLEELKNKYNVEVIARSNHGLSATRNYGASIAKGRFIAFLDPDDTIEKTYYELAIYILKKYINVHFVGCWLTYFGEGKGTWPTFNPEPPYILLHNSLNTSSLVFEKNTFLENCLNKTEMIYGMEDWETVINLVKKGFRGVSIPLKLFNYRVRKGSMAQSFTREKQLYLYKIIGESHKDFYNKFGPELVQILNANGPSLYFDNPTFEVITQLRSRRISKIENKVRSLIRKNKRLKKIAYYVYKKIK